MTDEKPAAPGNFWAPADRIIASTRLPWQRRHSRTVRVVAPSSVETTDGASVHIGGTEIAD